MTENDDEFESRAANTTSEQSSTVTDAISFVNLPSTHRHHKVVESTHGHNHVLFDDVQYVVLSIDRRERPPDTSSSSVNTIERYIRLLSTLFLAAALAGNTFVLRQSLDAKAFRPEPSPQPMLHQQSRATQPSEKDPVVGSDVLSGIEKVGAHVKEVKKSAVEGLKRLEETFTMRTKQIEWMKSSISDLERSIVTTLNEMGAKQAQSARTLQSALTETMKTRLDGALAEANSNQQPEEMVSLASLEELLKPVSKGIKELNDLAKASSGDVALGHMSHILEERLAALEARCDSPSKQAILAILAELKASMLRQKEKCFRVAYAHRLPASICTADIVFPALRIDQADSGLEVLRDGRSVKVTSSGSNKKTEVLAAMASPGMESGCHYWSVLIDKNDDSETGSPVMLGIIPKSPSSGGAAGTTPYFLSLTDGRVYHGSAPLVDRRQEPSLLSDRIGILLDMQQRTLAFYSDGVLVGKVADLKEASYYPIISLVSGYDVAIELEELSGF